jgi:hypothetical protein
MRNYGTERAMKNITITLDEETAAWARVHAAQRNVSLSRFVGGLLHQHMRESHEYEEAMRHRQRPMTLRWRRHRVTGRAAGQRSARALPQDK